MVWLAPGQDAAAVARTAAAAGVGVYPVGQFRQAGPGRPGLLLGYAALDVEQIRTGLARLAAVLRRADQAV
jgi:DNA-binding transcriptional MocR family regulator